MCYETLPSLWLCHHSTWSDQVHYGPGSGKKRKNKENEQLFAKGDEEKNTQCSLDHEVMKETLPVFFSSCKIL